MGTIEVKISDLSGEVVRDETQLTRLVVESHPNLTSPVTLEVLPEEIEDKLPEERDYVALSYYPLGEAEPQRVLMSLTDFKSLFQNVDPEEILQNTHQEQSGSQRRGRRQSTEPKQRIDYSSPEHAGEPHRGTISEAEKQYVRDNLEEVNARLREKGMREIDPNNPDIAERYSLTATTG